MNIFKIKFVLVELKNMADVLYLINIGSISMSNIYRWYLSIIKYPPTMWYRLVIVQQFDDFPVANIHPIFGKKILNTP